MFLQAQKRLHAIGRTGSSRENAVWYRIRSASPTYGGIELGVPYRYVILPELLPKRVFALRISVVSKIRALRGGKIGARVNLAGRECEVV